MYKIAFIVGSVRKGSFNRRVAALAEKMLGDRAEVTYIDPSSVPFMNQDAEFPAPMAVREARDIVSSCDAVWIFTPEYNRAIPGVLKNLLDWLSRPLNPSDPDHISAVTGKYVIITGVGGGKKTEFCRKQLSEVLRFMNMSLLDGEGRGFSVDRRAFVEDKWDPAEHCKEDLAEQIAVLMEGLADPIPWSENISGM